MMRESDLWPALRRYWHAVAFSEEVGEKPVAVRLLDKRVVVCRLGGEVKAFDDLCIHRGAALSLGWAEGESLVCPYHGWAYGGDGRCVRIPSLPPEDPIPRKARVPAYKAEERYGLVWVCLAAEPITPIPDFPEFDDPSYRVFLKQRKPWKGSAAREIENFVDWCHFPWVHEGILGDRKKPLPPDMHVTREDGVLRFWWECEPSQLYPAPHRRSYRVSRPFTIHNRNELPGDQREVFYVVMTPHSAKDSTRFMLLARNFNLDAPEVLEGPIFWKDEEIIAPRRALEASARALIDTMKMVYEQDFVIVGSQRPEELPLDLAEEFHLRGPDAVSLEYRRMMREIGVE